MVTSMKSALLAVLGVSLLTASVGCDGGSEDNTGGTAGTGVIPIGGTSTGTGGTGTTAGTAPAAGTGTTAGTGGTGTPASGVPLTAENGWVDGASNTLMVQGAMFAFADDFTKAGPPALAENFMGSNACITGTATKVDLMCTKPEGMDCYGLYWGAAIGLNLNQPTIDDPMNPGMMIGGDPMGFNASAIKGFAFEIAAPAGGAGMIPASSALRFKVDDGTAAGEFCTGKETPVKLGENTVTFDKLRTKCWEDLTKQPTPVLATSIQSKVVKISWQVVTNDKTTVPFDFCVTNVRALQ